VICICRVAACENVAIGAHVTGCATQCCNTIHNRKDLSYLQLLAQCSGPAAFCAVQVRSLSFNLKDPANPDLRARVLQGEIDPQVRRTSACDKQRMCVFLCTCVCCLSPRAGLTGLHSPADVVCVDWWCSIADVCRTGAVWCYGSCWLAADASQVPMLYSCRCSYDLSHMHAQHTLDGCVRC
jgi:hypothetical protein